MSTSSKSLAEDDARVKRGFAQKLRDIALFFVAPFFGLAYIVAFPFVIIAVAMRMGGKALTEFRAARRR